MCSHCTLVPNFHSTLIQVYKCEEGFDMRFSADGMWGRGNYFAENASYSHNYAHQLSGGQKMMFLAMVSVTVYAHLNFLYHGNCRAPCHHVHDKSACCLSCACSSMWKETKRATLGVACCEITFVG